MCNQKDCSSCGNHYLFFEPTRKGRGVPKICKACLSDYEKTSKFSNYKEIPESTNLVAHMRADVPDEEYEPVVKPTKKSFICPECSQEIDYVEHTISGTFQNVTATTEGRLVYEELQSWEGKNDIYTCPECDAVIAESEQDLLDIVNDTVGDEND